MGAIHILKIIILCLSVCVRVCTRGRGRVYVIYQVTTDNILRFTVSLIILKSQRTDPLNPFPRPEKTDKRKTLDEPVENLAS